MLVVTTINQHERNEWSRMAKAAYASGHNDVGHRMSAAAAITPNEVTGIENIRHIEALREQYRAWLCFNEYKD